MLNLRLRSPKLLETDDRGRREKGVVLILVIYSSAEGVQKHKELSSSSSWFLPE